MICSGCRRELEPGDHYIMDTASGFTGHEPDPVIDGLIADMLGGDDTLSGKAEGKVIFCIDCTVPGGDYLFETYYGEEDNS
jgi:hypothetical protein